MPVSALYGTAPSSGSRCRGVSQKYHLGSFAYLQLMEPKRLV